MRSEKLKVIHRFIYLNYQDAQGYSLENIWWTLSSSKVAFAVSKHNKDGTRTFTLQYKDIEINHPLQFGTLDTTAMGEALHLLNEAYYEKHLENPEEYPLNKWHNQTQAQRMGHCHV